MKYKQSSTIFTNALFWGSSGNSMTMGRAEKKTKIIALLKTEIAQKKLKIGFPKFFGLFWYLPKFFFLRFLVLVNKFPIIPTGEFWKMLNPNYFNHFCLMCGALLNFTLFFTLPSRVERTKTAQKMCFILFHLGDCKIKDKIKATCIFCPK